MSNKTRVKWNLLQFVEGEKNSVPSVNFVEIFSILTLIRAIPGLGSEFKRSHRWPKSRKASRPEIDFISEPRRLETQLFFRLKNDFPLAMAFLICRPTHTHAHVRENIMTSAKNHVLSLPSKTISPGECLPCAVSARFEKTPTSWCSSMEKRKKKMRVGEDFQSRFIVRGNATLTTAQRN